MMEFPMTGNDGDGVDWRKVMEAIQKMGGGTQGGGMQGGMGGGQSQLRAPRGDFVPNPYARQTAPPSGGIMFTGGELGKSSPISQISKAANDALAGMADTLGMIMEKGEGGQTAGGDMDMAKKAIGAYLGGI